jgi:hypothetical protein
MMKDNPSKVRANLEAIGVPFPAYTGPGDNTSGSIIDQGPSGACLNSKAKIAS